MIYTEVGFSLISEFKKIVLAFTEIGFILKLRFTKKMLPQKFPLQMT